MHLNTIMRIYADLPNGPVSDEFAVHPAVGNIYFGKSHLGQPCVVVRFDHLTKLPAGRTTEGLVLNFYPEFLLRDSHDSGPVCAGVLLCRDLSLGELFSVMVEGLLALADRCEPQPVSPYQLQEYVEDWQDLLAAKKVLSLSEQLGLWGELEFIHHSPCPERAVECWFGPKGNHFDFSGPGTDVDVKTSVRGHRHRFSLAQVEPSPSGASRYVFSIHAVEDPASGRSLSEEVELLRASVENRAELDKKLCAAGYVLGDVYTTRFSRCAEKWVSVERIPRVRTLDPGVSEVVFTADLTEAPSLGAETRERVLNDLLG